jgi:hypothetical protein
MDEVENSVNEFGDTNLFSESVEKIESNSIQISFLFLFFVQVYFIVWALFTVRRLANHPFRDFVIRIVNEVLIFTCEFIGT